MASNRGPRLAKAHSCSADGVFVWADVFRDSRESRQAFLQRYSERVRSGWHQLTAEQQRHVSSHLSRFDIPADRTAIQARSRNGRLAVALAGGAPSRGAGRADADLSSSPAQLCSRRKPMVLCSSSAKRSISSGVVVKPRLARAVPERP